MYHSKRLDLFYFFIDFTSLFSYIYHLFMKVLHLIWFFNHLFSIVDLWFTSLSIRKLYISGSKSRILSLSVLECYERMTHSLYERSDRKFYFSDKVSFWIDEARFGSVAMKKWQKIFKAIAVNHRCISVRTHSNGRLEAGFPFGVERVLFVFMCNVE